MVLELARVASHENKKLIVVYGPETPLNRIKQFKKDVDQKYPNIISFEEFNYLLR